MRDQPHSAAVDALRRLARLGGVSAALLFYQVASADTSAPTIDINAAESTSFDLDTELIDTLQFSRVDENDIDATDYSDYDVRTEVSFRLRPTMPKFSREGAYGLNMFGTPRMEVRQNNARGLFFNEILPDLHEGFAYSAGVRIEHNDDQADSTDLVSSSLLGVSYGRLGKLWYGGFDVNLQQFADEDGGDPRDDVVSLDVTTGLRLGFTGLDAASPLWLLSLQGNFDLHDEESADEEYKGEWFLNPSLFWQRPGFTFSAQVQVPMPTGEEPVDDDTPDYRLRAIFEKQF